jgi:hypothetical protein
MGEGKIDVEDIFKAKRSIPLDVYTYKPSYLFSR